MRTLKMTSSTEWRGKGTHGTPMNQQIFMFILLYLGWANEWELKIDLPPNPNPIILVKCSLILKIADLSPHIPTTNGVSVT